MGRTGRAGASGVAITFVDWADTTKWQVINKTLGLAFPEPLETYSNSAHVYTGLGIPTTATGKLPRAQRTREGLGAEQVEDLGETGKRQRSGGSGGSSRSGSSGGSSRSGSSGGSSRSGGSGGSSRSGGGSARAAEPAAEASGDRPARSSRGPRKRTRKSGSDDTTAPAS